MPLAADLKSVVEKIVSDAEAGVKEIDGQALAEARRLLAAAEDAEAGVLTLATQYKTDLLALLAKIPDAAVRQELTDLAEHLIDSLAGLFGAPFPG